VLQEGTADRVDVQEVHGNILPGPVSECPCGKRFEPGAITPACGQCFEEKADITRKAAN
jgi:hypothetical protein